MQIGQDLDDLAKLMPEATCSILQEKRKVRLRAIEALNRGEHVATRFDEEGRPLGGMILARMYDIVGVINEDGTMEGIDGRKNTE